MPRAMQNLQPCYELKNEFRAFKCLVSIKRGKAPMKQSDVERAARGFKRHLAIVSAKRETALARAKSLAARYDVIVWVYASKRGLVMDTARPQVQDAWRVEPTGETSFIRSGTDAR